jgi:hypothetical protein
VVVHAWLAFVGVVWIPARAFWDLDLYRYWMWLGLHRGEWPVLSGPSVYPAGALVPMLLASVAGTVGTAAYATSWSVMITLLDALAMVALLHAPRLVRHGLAGGGDEPVPDDLPRRRTLLGAWWWLAFLLLLGPIAMGRLDAVVAPVTIGALALALRHPRVASVLLTIGAWIKVAPGALMLPLFVSARRQWRDVVLPAAVVCLVVVVAVALGGGAANIASFLTEQTSRGLQIEAPGATPWLVWGLWSSDVTRFLDQQIITWEITGPGSGVAVDVLGWLMPLALLGSVALLWWRRERVGQGLWSDDRADVELLTRGSMLMVLVLLVFNKVGSPQYMGWLAAPVAVALALRLPRWRTTALVTLGIGLATQTVFPWQYDQIIGGLWPTTLVLAARNAALVALLVLTVRELVRRPEDADARLADPRPAASLAGSPRRAPAGPVARPAGGSSRGGVGLRRRDEGERRGVRRAVVDR